MEYCKLFIAVLLLVSGCAHQSNELYNTMNNCNVSIQTKPSNANVNIVTRSAYKYMGDIVFNESVSHYCNTPYNGVISSKEKTVFLFVEKEGFEQESIYVDMKNNEVNFNIVMEEAFELQIKKEKSKYKKELIISALEISNIGKKVLSADKSERRKIAQEIQGKYNILIVSFPEIKGSALEKCIKRMYEHAIFFAGVGLNNNREQLWHYSDSIMKAFVS